jgi:hypothetical protein
MRDFLRRLQQALPGMQSWLSELHAAHLDAATPVSTLGFTRLAAHFPETLLTTTCAVTVDVMPFPPVIELGLPEFEAMARMPMEGITFGEMYFVTPRAQEDVHFHELVHAMQWAALGWAEFLRAYAVGILQSGYAESPFESVAYELQSLFEKRDPLPQMLEFIHGHARAQHAETVQLFGEHGIRLGA